MAPNNSTGVESTDSPLETNTVSLATSIGGIPFSKVLLNSANPSATSIEQLTAFCESPATGAFTTRTACPGFVHCDDIHQWSAWSDNKNQSNSTINCFGYSSEQLDYYLKAIEVLDSKPSIVSVSGTAEQVSDMILTLSQQNRENLLVEINLSCPNFAGKPPIAYDFDAMREYLTTVFANKESYASPLVIGCKTTPYFYDAQFEQAAKVLNDFQEDIKFVTCINTVGCGLVIDVEREKPVVSGVYGGLGGSAVHATALANVRKLRTLLSDQIDIIGVGGVDSGAAAFSHILCGASAVAVGSAVLQQGVGVFDKIEAELLELMIGKGYTSLEDFRGKLKD